ncbi:MAG: leucine-rich repeat domain-containing protein, partial [Cyanobacteria bacterium J06639_1]
MVACSLAVGFGLSGCGRSPDTAAPPVRMTGVAPLPSVTTGTGSSASGSTASDSTASVRAIYQSDTSALGLDDVAIAIAVSRLPVNASEAEIAAAANRLLGDAGAIAPPFAVTPTVETVDFAAPAGAATVEDVAVIAAALNIPLFARQESFIFFPSNLILIPTGDLTPESIQAIPGLSLPNRPAEVLTFADANLEAAVRDRLDIPTGDIPAEEARRRVTFLSLSNRDVASLEGIDQLVNLERLFLSNNTITDLTPLVGLNRLEEVGAFGNAIADLSPLASLPNLKVLDVRSNQITSIAPLANAEQLTELSIGSNPQLTDFSPLRAIAQLEVLDLSISNIEDLSILDGLTQLRELDLSFTALSSLAPLSALTNLENLEIRRTSPKLDDLDFISSLSNLKTLRLSDNSIRSIDEIASLSDLTSLDLASNAIADLAPLANLTQLQTLDVSDNAVASIAPLESLPDLIDVNLEGDRVTDLAPLVRNLDFGAEDSLNISFNPLSSESEAAIAELSNRGVEVAFTPLEDESFDIEIEFIDNGLPAQFQDDVRAAAARWERAIARGLPSATFQRSANTCSNGAFPPTDLDRSEGNPVDDLLIQVAVAPLNGP